MKRRITLLVLTLVIPIFLVSCSAISQQEYDDVIAELTLMNTQYAQMTQENISLRATIGELESQLTESEQTKLSLETEIENYMSLPLTTDIVVETGNLIKGRIAVAPLNYFERIEGKVIGEGFNAYLKQSGGDIILDLGTDYKREFSFIPEDPFVNYFIDYEVLDATDDPPPYITVYVLFYP